MENIVATAAALVPPTDDKTEWTRQVIAKSHDIRRIAKAFDEHDGRISDALAAEADGTKKSFVAKLVAAKTVDKGNGMVKGYLQFQAKTNATSIDDEGCEYIETLPLSTSAGRFEFANAKQFVGKNVVVYKRLVPLPNGRKARECVAIELA